MCESIGLDHDFLKEPGLTIAPDVPGRSEARFEDFWKIAAFERNLNSNVRIIKFDDSFPIPRG